ncbi:acylphosphatase [bacterium]|nr:acylphosphatase [bacterium]
MSLCIKITCDVAKQDGFLRKFILKLAQKIGVEGIGQVVEGNNIRIIVCGQKELVDDFIDGVHAGSSKYEIDNIALEPFIRGRDYRGVFRVIE